MRTRTVVGAIAIALAGGGFAASKIDTVAMRSVTGPSVQTGEIETVMAEQKVSYLDWAWTGIREDALKPANEATGHPWERAAIPAYEKGVVPAYEYTWVEHNNATVAVLVAICVFMFYRFVLKRPSREALLAAARVPLVVSPADLERIKAEAKAEALDELRKEVGAGVESDPTTAAMVLQGQLDALEGLIATEVDVEDKLSRARAGNSQEGNRRGVVLREKNTAFTTAEQAYKWALREKEVAQAEVDEHAQFRANHDAKLAESSAKLARYRERREMLKAQLAGKPVPAASTAAAAPKGAKAKV